MHRSIDPARTHLTGSVPESYIDRVRVVHSQGSFGSRGYQSHWVLSEAEKNLLRTHTTAVSARMLYHLAQQNPVVPVRYFSIDRVFRNETLDATHLAEFHQVEGLVADYGLSLGHLKAVIRAFFRKLGLVQLRFKPAYNPYTEPSMEIFAYHPGHGSTTVHDLPIYMDSLNRIRQLVSRCEQETSQRGERFLLCPGHGMEMEHGLGKLDEYVVNRKSRIEKTREFLWSNPPNTWLTEDRILAYVYPDVHDALRSAARLNLRHSLFWLAAPASGSQAQGSDVIAQRESGELVPVNEFHTLLTRLDERYRLRTDRAYDAELNEKLILPWRWMRRQFA
ncbi:unnamed protein product [Echinostoma caproni]|uniref:phenylalanine--tRNA ligase n=1 Tax=Echinostoma caproni TaxID=27848 RepID=A0A3P8HJY7_9TREM|nr:unnamed protein product [Echinostoma caproni]